jgi:hypothetical protein
MCKPKKVGLPLAAEKRRFFAASNGLKTRALYVMLSLIKNICSILVRAHHERSIDHARKS